MVGKQWSCDSRPFYHLSGQPFADHRDRPHFGPVDPFNYSYIDGNGDMFVINPGQYNVTTIGYDPQIGAELLAITGKIYPRSMQQDNKVYSYYLQTSDMSDYYMGIFYRPAWENGIGV